ncbi:MAG: alpha/beta fold hydrolase [Sporichthyaceae bacterium]
MTYENAFYSPEFHGDYEIASIGALETESGGVIPDCQLAYATWGELNAAKDNAILISTWYSGTHVPWRDVYIGAEHALNPEKYFVVAVNQLGNGLSVSPHNATGENASIAMSKFPRLSIGDDVVAQERLLREKFGIESLALVVGGSMGAQQTYEWAVRFPDKVRRAAPIAGTAQATPHCQLFNDLVSQSMLTDPAFNGGEYASNTETTAAVRAQALVWAVMGFSPGFLKHEVYKAAGLNTKEEFVAFLEGYFAPLDVNSLLVQAAKWRYGDVANHAGGDLAAALARITARTFVMPIDHDMFFPVADHVAEQELIKNSELRVIEDIVGHFGLLGLNPAYIEQVDRHLNDLLALDA